MRRIKIILGLAVLVPTIMAGWDSMIAVSAQRSKSDKMTASEARNDWNRNLRNNNQNLAQDYRRPPTHIATPPDGHVSWRLP